jgi:hypothetical protein
LNQQCDIKNSINNEITDIENNIIKFAKESGVTLDTHAIENKKKELFII